MRTTEERKATPRVSAAGRPKLSGRFCLPGSLFIPGSHKWATGDGNRPDISLAQPVEMKSGSLFAWTGSLFHAGGGNSTTDRVRLAVNPNYHVSFLRQQEQVENAAAAVSFGAFEFI